MVWMVADAPTTPATLISAEATNNNNNVQDV